MELSNLGPLRSAELELADLTLLIGENNTGKTFFATVLHRVLDLSQSLPWRRRSGTGKAPGEVEEWVRTVLDSLDDAGTSAAAGLVPSHATVRWAESLAVETLRGYGASVRDSIAYAFGAEPARLRRRTPSRHATDCYLRVSSSEPDWQIEIRFDSDEIVVRPPDPRQWLEAVLSVDRIRQASPRLRRVQRSPEMLAHELIWEYPARLTSRRHAGFFPSWPSNAVHLPADRSGIMQSHNVLAGAAVRQSARAGIRPIEIETLPGTSADFLSLILEVPEMMPRLERDGSPFARLARRFEQGMRAEIAVEQRTDGLDAIVVSTPEGRFPMARASSMLSELAPLLLVLKSHLRVDHLTIDEPEAHLHPEMQVRVATFFAELVNSGMGIVLTTHSDFFVAQFNNMVRRHELSGPTGSTSSGSRSALDRSRIRALRFSRENGRCVARGSVPDHLDGIDESTFTHVMRSQYDETAGLVNELLEAAAGG